MRTEDLAIQYQVGKSYPTGTYRTTRNGYTTMVYKQRMSFLTKCGKEMWPEDWRKEITAAIKAEEKEELLQKILAHVRTHCFWLKREQEIQDYAMDCLAGRAYLHWEDFPQDE